MSLSSRRLICTFAWTLATAALTASIAAPALAQDTLAVPGAALQQPSSEQSGGQSDGTGDSVLSTRKFEPFVAIAGGVRFEDIQLRDGQTTQQRSPTVAVSRLGLRGQLGPYITFASLFEANIGGPLGYGASVWEGQAQMSVMDQFVKYDRCGWSFTFGRLTELASLDFYSAHVADLLFTDFYTRQPLLFSGFDRGSGVAVGFRPNANWSFGLSGHSTNPTGITGTLLIGGELFPFDRPFSLAAAQVGRNEFTLPDHNLHIYFFTPSIMYRDDSFQFKLAFQAYQLDTNMAIATDQRIYGYNIRANVKLAPNDQPYALFANISRNENELLDSADPAIKRVATYRSYVFGGGVDYQLWKNNGIGVQYVQVRQNDGMDPAVIDHYVNVGATYWIQDGLSVGTRLGWWVRDDEAADALYGHRSLFVTGRLVL